MTDPILHNVLFTFALSLTVQAVFFAFAATLTTDKVTDLSSGLTFVSIAGGWKRAHAPKKLLDWVGRYHAWERA